LGDIVLGRFFRYRFTQGVAALWHWIVTQISRRVNFPGALGKGDDLSSPAPVSTVIRLALRFPLYLFDQTEQALTIPKQSVV
jgi:hypothetical protein